MKRDRRKKTGSGEMFNSRQSVCPKREIHSKRRRREN
jgi:hypothetical protein